MTDPDLHIRGGGWGASPKKVFSALGASFWSKNKGAGPPGPYPGSATAGFPYMGKIPKDITNECIHYLAPDFHPSLSHRLKETPKRFVKAFENSRHFAAPLLVSQRDDV